MRAGGGEGAGTHQVTHEWDGLPLTNVRHAVNDDETTPWAARHTGGHQGPRKFPFLQQTSADAGAGHEISPGIKNLIVSPLQKYAFNS